jgi:hypothetical protein
MVTNKYWPLAFGMVVVAMAFHTASILPTNGDGDTFWRISSQQKSSSAATPNAGDMPSEDTTSQDRRCFRWEIDDDAANEWWTRHPTYEMDLENETHHCFAAMTNEQQVAFLQDLYDVQFQNCNNSTYTVFMIQAGWGAAFSLVIEELKISKETRQAVIFTSGKEGWRYAVNLEDGSQPTCPSRDLHCYYLDNSGCSKYINPNVKNERTSNQRRDFRNRLWADTTVEAGWMYDFVTRPQAWLRRAVYHNTQNTTQATVHLKSSGPDVSLSPPCAVFHVRRADVVLNHAKKVRRYHAIGEYVRALAEMEQQQQTQRKILQAAADDGANSSSFATTPNAKIFLLTDDRNAIDEALANFPQIHWTFIDRKRHAGAEGGMSNHIPSKSPRQEVVVIETTYSWVQDYCNDVLVHTTSTFAKNLAHSIRKGNENARILNMDENLGFKDIYNIDYRKTTNLSVAIGIDESTSATTP